MKSVWRFLQFLRFPMFLVPVLIFGVGMAASGAWWPLGQQGALALGAMTLLAAATFTYNGYEDRFIDERKGNAFAAQHPAAAAWVSGGLYAGSLTVAAALGTRPLMLFLVYTLCSVAYSRWLVKILVIKNFAAALLSAILVLLGGTVVGQVTTTHIILAVTIFFAITAMEIVKDIEDLPVDAGYRRTLPAVLPLPVLRRIVLGLVLLAATALLLLPHSTQTYLVALGPALICFLTAALLLPPKLSPHAGRPSRQLLYAGLWFGALAMLLAVRSTA